MEGIVHGDNLAVLRELADESVQMVYTDPPFNTGPHPDAPHARHRRAAEDGDRTGFGGRRYASELLERSSYRDAFDDYLALPRAAAARRSAASCTPPEPSTSTSTTGRRTTRSCCSTSCSARPTSSTS